MDNKVKARKNRNFNVSLDFISETATSLLTEYLQNDSIERIEKLIKNKKSAEYVKNLATNTIPKQTYLYQRFIEDSIGKMPNTKKKTEQDQVSTANLLNKMNQHQSNLDMEFIEINEANMREEESPLKINVKPLRGEVSPMDSYLGEGLVAPAPIKRNMSIRRRASTQNQSQGGSAMH